MSRNYFLPFLLLSVFTLSLSSCSKKDPHTGMWSWEVKDTPEGDVSGEMAISKVGDDYEGALITNGQSSELKNLEIDNNVISFESSAGGYFLKVTGTITEGILDGKLSVEGYNFNFKGNKISDTVTTP